MWQIPRLLAVGAVLTTAVACSDSFKPTTEDILGMYKVESFTTDSAGTSHDLFAAGATLELIILPFGDVVGALNVPPIPPDTATFYASMNGTWALNGNTVRFTQDADSFVRDMDWIADMDRLSGDKSFGAVRVRVVLKRQPGPPLP